MVMCDSRWIYATRNYFKFKVHVPFLCLKLNPSIVRCLQTHEKDAPNKILPDFVFNGIECNKLICACGPSTVLNIDTVCEDLHRF